MGGWLLAVTFLILSIVAFTRDMALPRADFSGESQHIGEEVAYLLDYGTIGRVDAATYPAIEQRMIEARGVLPSVGFRYYQGGMLWFRFVVPTLETSETTWNIRLDDY